MPLPHYDEEAVFGIVRIFETLLTRTSSDIYFHFVTAPLVSNENVHRSSTLQSVVLMLQFQWKLMQ